MSGNRWSRKKTKNVGGINVKSNKDGISGGNSGGFNSNTGGVSGGNSGGFNVKSNKGGVSGGNSNSGGLNGINVKRNKGGISGGNSGGTHTSNKSEHGIASQHNKFDREPSRSESTSMMQRFRSGFREAKSWFGSNSNSNRNNSARGERDERRKRRKRSERDERSEGAPPRHESKQGIERSDRMEPNEPSVTSVTSRSETNEFIRQFLNMTEEEQEQARIECDKRLEARKKSIDSNNGNYNKSNNKSNNNNNNNNSNNNNINSSNKSKNEVKSGEMGGMQTMQNMKRTEESVEEIQKIRKMQEMEEIEKNGQRDKRNNSNNMMNTKNTRNNNNNKNNMVELDEFDDLDTIMTAQKDGLPPLKGYNLNKLQELQSATSPGTHFEKPLNSSLTPESGVLRSDGGSPGLSSLNLEYQQSVMKCKGERFHAYGPDKEKLEDDLNNTCRYTWSHTKEIASKYAGELPWEMDKMSEDSRESSENSEDNVLYDPMEPILSQSRNFSDDDEDDPSRGTSYGNSNTSTRSSWSSSNFNNNNNNNNSSNNSNSSSSNSNNNNNNGNNSRHRRRAFLVIDDLSAKNGVNEEEIEEYRCRLKLMCRNRFNNFINLCAVKCRIEKILAWKDEYCPITMRLGEMYRILSQKNGNKSALVTCSKNDFKKCYKVLGFERDNGARVYYLKVVKMHKIKQYLSVVNDLLKESAYFVQKAGYDLAEAGFIEIRDARESVPKKGAMKSNVAEEEESEESKTLSTYEREKMIRKQGQSFKRRKTSDGGMKYNKLEGNMRRHDGRDRKDAKDAKNGKDGLQNKQKVDKNYAKRRKRQLSVSSLASLASVAEEANEGDEANKENDASVEMNRKDKYETFDMDDTYGDSGLSGMGASVGNKKKRGMKAKRGKIGLKGSNGSNGSKNILKSGNEEESDKEEEDVDILHSVFGNDRNREKVGKKANKSKKGSKGNNRINGIEDLLDTNPDLYSLLEQCSPRALAKV